MWRLVAAEADDYAQSLAGDMGCVDCKTLRKIKEIPGQARMVSGTLGRVMAWQRLCQLWKLAPAINDPTLAVQCPGGLCGTLHRHDGDACFQIYSSGALLA